MRINFNLSSVRFQFNKTSASWELEPYIDGEYALVLDNRGVFPIPQKGSMSYVMELLTGGYIRYLSHEGWITQSPHFHISPPNSFVWARTMSAQ